MSDYNGWTNWETWNVALWIDNEYAIYGRRGGQGLNPPTHEPPHPG